MESTSALPVAQELFRRHANFPRDLAQEDGLDIPTLMTRDGPATSAVVAKLLVGSTLTDLNEPESLEDRNDLLGLKDREATHRSSHGDVLDADELGLEDRIPVLEEHGDNLPQIVGQLVHGLALGMGIWKPGDESH